jgi:uncharacterized protein YjbI with pentapeptide repeats
MISGWRMSEQHMLLRMKLRGSQGSGALFKALGAVVFFAVFLWLVGWLPWVVEGEHAHDKSLHSSAGILITGFRTAILAVLAGVIALGTLYLSYKNHRVSQEQLRETQKQFNLAQEQFKHTQEKDREQAELTREGQVTERYVEAIKLLSSENLTQRLGGIYSLQRIMSDSEKDKGTVTEVLAAFIRQTSEAQKVGKGREAGKPMDVQAALNILGEGRRSDEDNILSLSCARMNEAALHGNFSNFFLDRTSLQGALIAADLRHANLAVSDARDASFLKADMSNADLSGANMQGASLIGVNLENVDFTGVNLRRATLAGCSLKNANLRGVDLRDVQGMAVTDLLVAEIDSATKLPPSIAQDSGIQARVAACEAEPPPLPRTLMLGRKSWIPGRGSGNQ